MPFVTNLWNNIVLPFFRLLHILIFVIQFNKKYLKKTKIALQLIRYSKSITSA